MSGAFQNIPAFCINLDARADRWAQAQDEFARVEWPVRRWAAACLPAPPSSPLSAGHYGCLESHRQIWRYCLTEQLDMVAVFEDDVVLASDLKDIFAASYAELPPDWDVWHFHSSHATCEPATPRLVRITGKMWGTHGYLIRAAGCKKLLALPDSEPIDYRMSEALHANNGRIYGSDMKYALAFQRGVDSNIPETAALGFWRAQRRQFGR